MSSCRKDKCKWYSLCKGEIKITKDDRCTKYGFLALPISELPKDCPILKIYKGEL